MSEERLKERDYGKQKGGPTLRLVDIIKRGLHRAGLNSQEWDTIEYMIVVDDSLRGRNRPIPSTDQE